MTRSSTQVWDSVGWKNADGSDSRLPSAYAMRWD